MIYPIPPVTDIKSLIEYVTQSEEDSGIVFVCKSVRTEGKNIWTLWTSYMDEKKHFSFIRLYHYNKDDRGWWYEQRSYEVEFGDHFNCPIAYLDSSTDSPYIDQEWRDSVREKWEQRIPEDWEQCKRLFRKHSANNTGCRVRVYFKNMRSVRGTLSEDIPYADLVSIYPLRGRYKHKLYELKRSCITGFKVLPKPKHPRGHSPRHTES